MVRRILFALLLALPAARADERSSYVDAKAELERAYFDTLEPDERDRLFEAYGLWDNHQVIVPLAAIASRFGTYMVGLEGELASAHKNYREKYGSRTALTDIEVGLRNSLVRKIDRKEAELREATASFDLLGRVVGRYEDEKTVQHALTIFGRHATWRVRQLLAMACAHWEKFLKGTKTARKAFGALKALVGDDETRVRVAAARSLGHFKNAEALELCKKCLGDPDWRVRGASLKSLGRMRTDESVGVLIAAMAREKGRLQDDIASLLQSVTGLDFKYAEEWQGWWKAVGQKIPPRDYAPQDTRGTDAAQKTPKKRKPGHRFYGIPSNSDRICYIIDVSGSMAKEVEQWKRVTITGRKQSDEAVMGKTRLDVAKNELKRAVSNLNPRKRFLIIFFSHRVTVWRPKPVFASPANKRQANKDTDVQKPSGATYTLGALREAFTIAGAIGSQGATKKDGARIDTIFLLSDGGPTDNKLEGPKPMDPDLILEQVRQWNKDAGIVIHTIAVDTLEAGTYFLKSLAAQNGGQFVERRNPTEKKAKKEKK